MTWQPIEQTISTPWTATVKPDNALPEYPRPQLVRDKWLNLNGLWDYAIEDIDFRPVQGLADQPSFTNATLPVNWQGQILVPFAIDSPLSGVMQLIKANQRLWYRRNINLPSDWDNRRVLLHFQAADWETSVYLNGQRLGQHRGGYDPFTFDLTNFLHTGANELVVCCWDATEYQAQALGKQIMPENRQGFRYQPTSGIWQTVWLEAVPEQSIRKLRITPDVDRSCINVGVMGVNLDSCAMQITALAANQQVAQVTASTDSVVAVPIPEPKLWRPDDPFLYDLHVDLLHNGEIVDSVTSYCGMRKVSLGTDARGDVRFLLNDEPIFQLGPLDQGYWPDGILTPPSEEAIVFDLEYLKQIACNMVRVHIKTHPDRWYYHCDRLGLLVWQDMISMPKFDQTITPTAAQQWQSELEQMLDWLHNHPSIVQWIVFNEAWGQHNTEYYVDLVKERDSSRLVTNASGWTDVPVGDIYDIHDYTLYPATAAQAIANERAVLLGEAGGFNVCIPDHNWYTHETPSETIDYVHDITRSTYPTPEALADNYGFWVDNLRCLRAVAPVNGVVYTQISDVEHELNGWLTYDRRVSKIPPDTLAAIHAKLYDPVELTTLLSERAIWHWSNGENISKPAVDAERLPRENLPDFAGSWCQPEYDDSGWATGGGPFGDAANPGILTALTHDYLYLRTPLNLDALPTNLLFHVTTSADCQLFINGQLIRSLRIRQHSAPISETCSLLRPDEMTIFKPGENVLSAVLLPSSRPAYLAIRMLDVIL